MWHAAIKLESYFGDIGMAFVRSGLLIVAFIVATFSPAQAGLWDRLGGRFGDGAADKAWSPETKALINQVKLGIDPSKVIDHHAHIIALPDGGLGPCGRKPEVTIHKSRNSWLTPSWKIRTEVLRSASLITDDSKANQQYADRVMSLVKQNPVQGKIILVAMANNFKKNGDGTYSPDKDKTDLYMSNDYVVDVVDCLNTKLPGDRFIAAISVHPGDPDALTTLDTFQARGVKYVKWLPNAMNIDPSETDYLPFYKRMAANKMTLIAHTGEEAAIRVDPKSHQAFGNPALYDMALREAGVQIILSHMGRDGYQDEFLTMMKKDEYKGCLFGDISAMAMRKGELDYLWRVLDDDNWKHFKGRIVNGTDYPLSAVHYFNSTKAIIKHNDAPGVAKSQKKALTEIYQNNPLLYDFTIKRLIRNKGGKAFPPEVFYGINRGTASGDYGCEV